MNMAFYTASVGAQQQQYRLDVHANNIANVNTDGFKSKIPSFSALMYTSVDGADGATLKTGTGSYMSAAATNYNSNGLVETGISTDYAIEGDGFFALWNPTTGEYTYTRDGSFTKAEYNATGEETTDEDTTSTETETESGSKWYLSDGQGRFVLNEQGGLIELGDSEEALSIGIFDFVNTEGMLSAGDNTLVPTESNGQVQIGDGTLVQGYLEASNTDLATELTKVIEAQRSFSYALKMMQTADELETTANNLR